MDSTGRVAARMARIEKRPGMAAWEEKHFALWEKQLATRKQSWNAELAQQDHERRMRDAVEAD